MPVFTLPKSAHPDFALPNVKPIGPVKIAEKYKSRVIAGWLFTGDYHDVEDKFPPLVWTAGSGTDQDFPRNNIEFHRSVGESVNIDFTNNSSLSLIIRFKGNNIGANGEALFTISAASGNNQRGVIIHNGSIAAGNQFAAVQRNTDWVNASVTDPVCVTGQWHTGLAVWDAGSPISNIYSALDNSSFTTNTAAATTSPAKLDFGRLGDNTPNWEFDGEIESAFLFSGDIRTIWPAIRDNLYGELLEPAIPLTYFMPAEEAAQYFTFELPKSHHPDFALPGVKPKGRVEIDWDNGIAKGLIHYGIDFDNLRQKYTVGTAISETITDKGKTLTGAGTNNEGIDTGDTTAYPEITLFVVCRSTNAPGGGVSGPLHKEGNGIISWHNDNAAYQGVFTYESGFPTYSFGTILADTWYALAGSADGTGGAAYKDGVKTASGADVLTAQTDELKVFEHSTSGTGWEGDVSVFYVWDRVLSDAEHASIAADPFQLFRPAIPLTYFVPAAAAGGNEPLFYHHQRMLSRCS